MPLILSSRGKKEEEPKKTQSRAFKTMFGTFAAKSPVYQKDKKFRMEVMDRANEEI